MKFISSLLFFLSLGCASSSPEGGNPHSAAYGADSYFFEAQREPRTSSHGVEFYFKRCSLENSGIRGGYGRAYDCTEP